MESSGKILGIVVQDGLCADRENLPCSRMCKITAEIPIGMVGKIEPGWLICFCLKVYRQGIAVIERIGHRYFALARITVKSVCRRVLQCKCCLIIIPGDIYDVPLGKRKIVEASVQLIHTFISGKKICLPINAQFAAADTSRIGT